MKKERPFTLIVKRKDDFPTAPVKPPPVHISEVHRHEHPHGQWPKTKIPNPD